jgi:hypothetical protein
LLGIQTSQTVTYVFGWQAVIWLIYFTLACSGDDGVL